MVNTAAIGAATAAVTLILLCVAVGTNYWDQSSGTVSGTSYTANEGLWQSCISIAFQSQCNSIDCSQSGLSSQAQTLCNKLNAIRAFAILAVLTIAGALIAQALWLTNLARHPRVSMSGVAQAVASGLCAMIAFAIFASLSLNGASYGYSFALEIVGFIGALAAAGLFRHGTGEAAYTTMTDGGTA